MRVDGGMEITERGVADGALMRPDREPGPQCEGVQGFVHSGSCLHVKDMGTEVLHNRRTHRRDAFWGFQVHGWSGGSPRAFAAECQDQAPGRVQ